MKLYEVIEVNPAWLRQYFTTKSVALGMFSGTVKLLKDSTSHNRLVVIVNMIEVNTNLKAQDWVELLVSDAPGPTMLKTPVDFITSRTELKRWEKGADK